MYRHAVAPRTASAHRRIEPRDAGEIDQPDHRLARNYVGDRDAPQRKAAQEIVGAVNRIDHPAPLGRRSSALLPEKAILRKSLDEARANPGFDLTVGDAYGILWALGLPHPGL